MTTNATHMPKKRHDAYAIKRGIKKWGISIFRGLLLFGLCFMIIQPMITRLLTSIMEEKDLYDSTIVLLPRNVTTDNYMHVANMTSFPESMINTLWLSLLVALCQILSTTLVAYGFARYDFPLKKFWFALVIAVIIIPPQTISSSLYTTFANFDFPIIWNAITQKGIIRGITGNAVNLRGSIVPYIAMSLTCMGLKNGLYIFMLRQYFKGVPKSLEEAAYVDGCGTMHTFVKIMLPDAVPIIASCFLFAFVWQWTDVFYARSFVPNQMHVYAKELSTIVSKMSHYFNAGQETAMVVPAGRQQQLISVGVVICAVPLIILYIFTQKTFVQSLAMTGSKE
ncbi:MAG: carbohydrate ABC transporter permease [Clostridiales bacterium]|nr:carbohydrate ABC transporter permease [Clostridiales bacterium]